MAETKRVKVTNTTSKGRGFRDGAGRNVYLRPGQTKQADLTKAQIDQFAVKGRPVKPGGAVIPVIRVDEVIASAIPTESSTPTEPVQEEPVMDEPVRGEGREGIKRRR